MPYNLDNHRQNFGNNCCANPLYHASYWTICCCICMVIAIGILTVVNQMYADWVDATGTVVGVVIQNVTERDSRGHSYTIPVYCAKMNFLTEEGENVTAIGEDFCQESSTFWREGKKYEILYDPMDPEGGIMLTEFVNSTQTTLTGSAIFSGLVFGLCLCLTLFFIRKKMFENNQNNQNNNQNNNNPYQTTSPFQQPNPVAVAEPVSMQPPPQTQQNYGGGGFASALGQPPASAPPATNPWIK